MKSKTPLIFTSKIGVIDTKNLYKIFKDDRIGNCNVIIDLLKATESSDIKAVRKAMGILHKIFYLLIKEGDIKDQSHTALPKAQTPRATYDLWLYERFVEVHEHHLNILSRKEAPLPVRKMALMLILKLLQKEALYPVSKECVSSIQFPVSRLKKLYSVLLRSDNASSLIIEKRLHRVLQASDFLLVSLHVLAEIVKDNKEEGESVLYRENFISILQLIQLPEEGKKPLRPPTLFIAEPGSGRDVVGSDTSKKFEFPYKEGRALFSRIWEAVLHFSFSSAMYKRCLVVLPEVMKHLEQPVRLTDFFMNSYNIGGIHSLLAMHGVYILVTQYNLEYSSFYEKVYALFTPDIFLAKYKARFFQLCDKFFLSPYIPEYVAAAVVKRCCRLMLTAPSPCLFLLIKFVVNLLQRFPSLRTLINNPNATSVEDDPFVENGSNLLLSRAIESSLWEVETLRQHPLCDVAKAANFITRNMPDVEHDILKPTAITYQHLYHKAKKIKEPRRVTTTFYKPEGLFKYSDDAMSSSWSVI